MRIPPTWRSNAASTVVIEDFAAALRPYTIDTIRAHPRCPR